MYFMQFVSVQFKGDFGYILGKLKDFCGCGVRIEIGWL